MEMERKTVHRGIVALAIVTSLSAVGSRPAAALDLGFLDRLNQLWSFATGDAHRATGRVHRSAEKTPTVPGAKTGWGIDPNGDHLVDPDPITQRVVPSNG
jgi:hypothetical protein